LAGKTNAGVAKVIADRAGAEYVQLAAAVGQVDYLQTMLAESKAGLLSLP